MKFNWGTGIFLFYTVFVAALVFQVIKSTKYDNSLVSNEYYKEDLAYQQKYDKIQNSMNLKEKVQIDFDRHEDKIIISFPFESDEIDGDVFFYRPSTQLMDMEFDLQLNESAEMVIPTEKITTGRWRISVDWSRGEDVYFDEKIIDLM